MKKNETKFVKLKNKCIDYKMKWNKICETKKINVLTTNKVKQNL